MNLSPEDNDSEILTDAENAVRQAKGLTHQLLTFSKGGVPVKKLSSIKAPIKDSVEFALRGSNIKCLYHLSENLWLAEIDVNQISQVMNNLVINAIQAMPEGGNIEIRANNITIDAQSSVPVKKGKYLHVTVADQGSGIITKDIKKIFDPYFSTKKEGSGLGLATSYYIIKNHDGYIHVKAEKDMGTIFHIYLPASERKLQAIRDNTDNSLEGKGKILIMDDDEIVLKSIGKMLIFLGYEISLSRDGKEALDLYEKALKESSAFHIVLMDLTVPGGMGGKIAVQKLKKIHPEANVIVSSGYSNDPIMADYKTYGFCGVIVKPYDINELGILLKKILEKQ